ncbi:lysophosphatidic acid receptor 1-A-like [Branchiostoma floridae]|uniref:Lysophosphatidic acid receptor 1-A-like n=1 Tax=Branchiostoma floridae TaxID=7739 RepID=A0A9J7NCX7_BRAFL|nr:lysophosphatidic acid receptor 1-A-like [Branchiostoma floridae]
MIFLATWSIVGNCLPIAAIIKHEKLHKPVYLLMANVAASDICTGVSLLIMASTVYYHNGAKLSFALSRFVFTAVLLSGVSSAFGLLSLTTERYWFIVHGMTYVKNVTNDKCKVMIIVVWVLSVILAMLPNFGWNCTVQCVTVDNARYTHVYLGLVLVFVFIPMAAIVCLNTGIFWCLWKQVSAIRRQEAAVHAQHSTSRKSSITILIITILFLMGWLPFCIRMVEVVSCKQNCNETDPPMLGFVVLNSALNPIIYGFRLKEIRGGVKPLSSVDTNSASFKFCVL